MATTTQTPPKSAPSQAPSQAPKPSAANGPPPPATAPAKPEDAALVKAADANNLRSLLASQMQRIENVIPKHLTPERMLRVALTAVQKSPQLWDCTAGSIVGCVTQASQLGLDLDPVLGHAYMVPYKNKHTGRREAQLQTGYKGLIALARRSGTVGLIYAHIVYEGDEFDVTYGSQPGLHHKPISEHRGDIAKAHHVYAVVTYPAVKEKDFEVMSRAEVFKIKARSKTAAEGPWVTDEPEMWRKTVIRRLTKRCPLSPEFMAAASLGDEVEFATVDSTGGPSRLPVGRMNLRAPAELPAPPTVEQPSTTDPEPADAPTITADELKRINEAEAAAAETGRVAGLGDAAE